MSSMDQNDVTRIVRLSRLIQTTDDPKVAADAARKMRREAKKRLDRLQRQKPQK